MQSEQEMVERILKKTFECRHFASAVGVLERGDSLLLRFLIHIAR